MCAGQLRAAASSRPSRAGRGRGERPSRPARPVGPSASSTNVSVPGIALPDRRRLLVEQLGLEVADALALREAVHAEDERVREELEQAVVEVRRERRGRVRHRVTLGNGRARPCIPSSVAYTVGTPGKTVISSSSSRFSVSAREDERALEERASRRAARHQQLVEAVVERERQDAQDPVVGAEPQVLARCCPRRRPCSRASASRPSGCRCSPTCRSARRGRRGIVPGSAGAGSAASMRLLEVAHVAVPAACREHAAQLTRALDRVRRVLERCDVHAREARLGEQERRLAVVEDVARACPPSSAG